MPEGKLKFFNVRDGYGFVKSDKGDVMVHIATFNGAKTCHNCGKKLIGRMPENTPIRYELATDEGRLRASSWEQVASVV